MLEPIKLPWEGDGVVTQEKKGGDTEKKTEPFCEITGSSLGIEKEAQCLCELQKWNAWLDFKRREQESFLLSPCLYNVRLRVIFINLWNS